MTDQQVRNSIVDVTRCLKWLADWGRFSEAWWHELPELGVGFYGTGYNSWAVQTNQKYLAAMAVLATHEATPMEVDRQWALERALTALRFSLESHLTGSGRCTDGSSWGHTWISGLGVERMMHAIPLLEPHLTGADKAKLRRMLASEADWIWQDHIRSEQRGVIAGQWNHSKRNVPESNIWNGALLWRTAAMYPEHPNAEQWREQAHRFLINGVSVPEDAYNDQVIAGRPVRDWHVGANFFSNFALDHHGYMNVGYMAICQSNAAMLHFDLKALGLPRPESLDHHQQDLWHVFRRMIFSDGRLARIGGDSRVRYCYCQEYLLPALLYAADCFGELHARTLTDGLLGIIGQEVAWSGDGGFYSRRLKAMQNENPYYYTRLESDRACAIGQAVIYNGLVAAGAQDAQVAGADAFEASVAGGWEEPEHGAVLHRSATRLASFSWRAHSQTQAMCQQPDDSHLADWAQNMTGALRLLGEDPQATVDQRKHRQLQRYDICSFEGGFVTCGEVAEGMDLFVAEGWRGDDMARHHLAVAALPDGHTMVGLQCIQVNDKHLFAREVKGLHLNLINDFYNGRSRVLHAEGGTQTLPSPPEREEVLSLGSRWANVKDRVGVVGLYGAQTLAVHRSPTVRAGDKPMLNSLYVDDLNWHCEVGGRRAVAREMLLDVGWAVLSGVDRMTTQQWAELQRAPAVEVADGKLVRAVMVTGMDGCRYLVVANFEADAVEVSLDKLSASEDAAALDLATNQTASLTSQLTLLPGCARVWRMSGR